MKMQCFPLYTLLLALDSPTVDFLSLDIEVSIRFFQTKESKFSPKKGSRVGGAANYSMDKGATNFLPQERSASFSPPGGHPSYQRGDRVSHLEEKAPNVHLFLETRTFRDVDTR